MLVDCPILPCLTSILAWCVEGAKILELCQKGDKLLDEELAKVYKGKKIQKGASTALPQKTEYPRC